MPQILITAIKMLLAAVVLNKHTYIYRYVRTLFPNGFNSTENILIYV